MAKAHCHDITVLGAGPVGLFGAFYAGLRGMDTLIVDSLSELGGQLVALYPEKYVYDMPGFPRVLARDLSASMVEQAMRFHPAVALDEQARVLEWLADGSFEPNRLDVPGLRDFEGRGVQYLVRDRAQFADKRLLIVGGGDSALDWAMNLEPIAHSITLIHRSDRFRAHAQTVDWLLNHSRVATKTYHELRRLEGNGWLQRAAIADSRTGVEQELDVDACLVTIGFKAAVGPIRDWGLSMSGSRILVNSRMETNLEGIYAAGDACTYEGKLKLIATGVGEVCVAVNFAQTHIDPSAKAFPGHSSDMNL